MVEEGLCGPSLLKQFLNDNEFSLWELKVVSEDDSELGDTTATEYLQFSNSSFCEVDIFILEEMTIPLPLQMLPF